MKETIQLTSADTALARSGLYEALALGFQPPTEETVDRLYAKQQNQALSDLAGILAHGKSSRLQTLILNLRKCFETGSIDALKESYRFLFGHTAHAKVPPYETEYGSDTLFQQPQQLGDLSGFYTAFGLELNDTGHERADHISCQCEFLAFLNRKEAYAFQQNDGEMLLQTQKAQKLFFKDHLARFAPSFSNVLSREYPESFYSILGKILQALVSLESKRFHVQAGPENLRLRPKVTADDCLTCGGGQELIKEIAEQ